jgi:hypothetical protein
LTEIGSGAFVGLAADADVGRADGGADAQDASETRHPERHSNPKERFSMELLLLPWSGNA